MNTHPYLRAYMAGIVVPTLFLLVILTTFCVARFVYQVPVPIERALVFPMAVVPNLFGVWNILYVRLGSRRGLPLGLHGAILPFILAPLGAALGATLGFVTFTAQGVVWFQTLTVHYRLIGTVFPVVVVIYYLVWKHLVGFLNRFLGIA